MRTKRGELATSTLIIIIATLILVTGFLYGYFNEMDDLVSESYTNVRFTESSLTKGFEILEIEAADGRSNGFTEFFLTTRLLPDSGEVDFNSMNILVSMHNWSSGLIYHSGDPVQNDSGYVGYANGTGFYQVQTMIKSKFHKADQITRGETIRIYVHLPHLITDDKTLGFNIITSNGVSFPITVFTGETIPATQYVLLFPKI